MLEGVAACFVGIIIMNIFIIIIIIIFNINIVLSRTYDSRSVYKYS
jgi:hypothetical protein